MPSNLSNSPWKPADQPPTLHDRERILGAVFSDKILIADIGRNVYTGWAWKWEEDIEAEQDARLQWQMFGPDGYGIVGVQYWAPIPDLP